jgi:thiamine biosynthesis protein ThiI
VASQTLTNIARVDEAATLPILRPLIGMDKLEITAEAQRLGTFEISIEPDADCCTLFVPRHPSTRVGEDEIRVAESRLDLPRLVAMGVQGARVENFEFPSALVDAAPPPTGAR